MGEEERKALNLKEIISPIKVFSSPLKNRENQDNLKQLESIVITLISNHEKWEVAHKRGSSLCNSIELIKGKAIEENSRSPNEPNLYPEGLKDYCSKLAIILTIFEDVVKSSKSIAKQLRNMVKLNKQATEIIFKTWSLLNVQETAEKINIAYEKEFFLKQKVTAEIAHCRTRNKLQALSKSWQYPEYTDVDLKLLVLFLQQEIKDVIKY